MKCEFIQPFDDLSAVDFPDRKGQGNLATINVCEDDGLVSVPSDLRSTDSVVSNPAVDGLYRGASGQGGANQDRDDKEPV
jgi:hypothetical protein